MGNLGARALQTAARVVIVVALVAFAASPAFAATRTHDMTFVAATADGSATFAGEEFSVWKVVDEDGGIVPAFAGVQANDDEAVWATALAEAAAGITPDAEFTTGADGTARLVLEKGAYLVVGSEVAADGVTYHAVPYVMDLTDHSIAESLTSYVKYTSDGPSPTAPEGDGGNGAGAASAETARFASSGDAVTAAALCAVAVAVVAAAAAIVARKADARWSNR